MVLNIEITPQIESRLRQQAEAAGQDMRTYVSQLIAQAAAKPSIDQILAPIRKKFAESGVGDNELINDITEAQSDYRADKHKKTA
jgi:hypothetical protein